MSVGLLQFEFEVLFVVFELDDFFFHIDGFLDIFEEFVGDFLLAFLEVGVFLFEHVGDDFGLLFFEL